MKFLFVDLPAKDKLYIKNRFKAVDSSPLQWSIAYQAYPAGRGEICPSRQSRRECKIFASGVNFSIFTHFLCFFLLKLLKLGEIDGVKFLAWKSGGVKFWTNSMSGYHQDLNQLRQLTSILALYLSLATSRLITHHIIRIVIITNNQGLYSNVTKPGPTPFRSQTLVPPAQYLPHQTSLTGLG